MQRQRNHAVAELTWDAVAKRLGDGAAAILPVGAGAKQHGLHLPMNSDQIQAEHFSAQLAAHIDGLIWPTLLYGWYPAFVAYPGSTSISNATFEALVQEIAEGLLGHGARQIFVLNTGISTARPIDTALSRLSEPARARHLDVHTGARYRAAVAGMREQAHGSHADEIETSIMLALAPSLVDMSRAEASPPLAGGIRPGALTPDDRRSPNYSPSGTFGDPTKATAEKGRVLIEAIMHDLIAGAR